MKYLLRITALILIIVFTVFAKDAKHTEKLNFNLDKQKLLAGELQVFTEEYAVGEIRSKRVVGVMLLNAAPAKVWQALKDWDSMSNVMDSLEYYKTVAKLSSGESLIEGKLKVAMFFSVCYTLFVKFDEANYRQDWRLVSDSEAESYKKKNIELKKPSAGIKDIQGYEYIEPYGDGSKTVFYYAPIVEVSVPVPQFVDKAASKSSLKEFMFGVKKKVESMK